MKSYEIDKTREHDKKPFDLYDFLKSNKQWLVQQLRSQGELLSVDIKNGKSF